MYKFILKDKKDFDYYTPFVDLPIVIKSDKKHFINSDIRIYYKNKEIDYSHRKINFFCGLDIYKNELTGNNIFKRISFEKLYDKPDDFMIFGKSNTLIELPTDENIYLNFFLFSYIGYDEIANVIDDYSFSFNLIYTHKFTSNITNKEEFNIWEVFNDYPIIIDSNKKHTISNFKVLKNNKEVDYHYPVVAIHVYKNTYTHDNIIQNIRIPYKSNTVVELPDNENIFLRFIPFSYIQYDEISKILDNYSFSFELN
jgi:hypothetical protein